MWFSFSFCVNRFLILPRSFSPLNWFACICLLFFFFSFVPRVLCLETEFSCIQTCLVKTVLYIKMIFLKDEKNLLWIKTLYCGRVSWYNLCVCVSTCDCVWGSAVSKVTTSVWFVCKPSCVYFSTGLFRLQGKYVNVNAFVKLSELLYVCVLCVQWGSLW